MLKKEIVIKVDSDLALQCEEIASSIGLNLELVLNIALARISKEGGISWMLNGGKENAQKSNDSYIKESNYDAAQIETYGKCTKNMAIRLLKNKGYEVHYSVTFASKNRSAYNYWANPGFDILKDDWSLILNDWPAKKLYLFNIPANSISLNALTPRRDRGKENIIDLQITYRDITFTDSRSNFSFAKYLIASIDY